MSDENLIGHGTCPLCGNAKARFTFSKKSLACIVCNACNFQGFARSDNSDSRLRSLVKPVTAKQEPKAPEVQAVRAEAAIKPIAEAAPVPVKKPAPGWGIFGALNG